jgi:hypothetical protein
LAHLRQRYLQPRDQTCGGPLAGFLAFRYRHDQFRKVGINAAAGAPGVTEFLFRDLAEFAEDLGESLPVLVDYGAGGDAAAEARVGLWP